MAGRRGVGQLSLGDVSPGRLAKLWKMSTRPFAYEQHGLDLVGYWGAGRHEVGERS